MGIIIPFGIWISHNQVNARYYYSTFRKIRKQKNTVFADFIQEIFPHFLMYFIKEKIIKKKLKKIWKTRENYLTIFSISAIIYRRCLMRLQVVVNAGVVQW